MRTPRIYTEQALQPGMQLELESGPSIHIARAMRMRPGDRLTVFNGRGGEYDATLAAVEKKFVSVAVECFHNRDLESPLAIHLGIAVSRGDRMDWVVQKATELGVASIAPLFSERTEVRLKGDRAAKKHQHWHHIAIAACEQCGRNSLPRIEPPATLPNWLATTEASRKYVLHHRAQTSPGAVTPPSSIALLVGPEGGLSETEITLAEERGFQGLRLGSRVMRTETAPLAAIAILQAQWGDMSPL